MEKVNIWKVRVFEWRLWKRDISGHIGPAKIGKLILRRSNVSRNYKYYGEKR